MTTAPRIRWAGIVWGLVFAALAIAALVIAVDTDRFRAAGDILAQALLAPDPVAIIGLSVIGVGALTLLSAAVFALTRRGRRAESAARRTASEGAASVEA